MCHNNKPFALTQCHTTSNEVECKRIEHAGGKIVRNGNNILVNGVSSVTRGLGKISLNISSFVNAIIGNKAETVSGTCFRALEKNAVRLFFSIGFGN